MCFIKTTNLDGESNLKIRRPVDLKGDAPENIAEVSTAVGSILTTAILLSTVIHNHTHATDHTSR